MRRPSNREQLFKSFKMAKNDDPADSKERNTLIPNFDLIKSDREGAKHSKEPPSPAETQALGYLNIPNGGKK